jgi:leucyl aminopeptidase
VINLIKYLKDLNLKNEERTIVVGLNEQHVLNEFETIINGLKTRKETIFNLGELTVYYPLDTFMAKRVIFVGLGKKQCYELKDVQTVFSKVAKEVNEDAVVLADTFASLDNSIEQLVEKLTETIGLVNYNFNDYKTNKKENKEYSLFVNSVTDVSKAIEFGTINAEATNNSRTLVNEPRNKLTPSILAAYAEKLAKRLNLDYKIYNKSEIEELKMGAFLSVNQGSKEEAKLIHLKYRNNEDGDVTALIGKGVTYDSGGYSIKPKDGMAGMKGDMGGAATVLGAIEAIARKQLKANVDVIIAATENLINSEAIVPDDVVVAMNGKTIEILNTDAEGRLTLVDAVTFAKQNNASQIIDVATLTGGVISALGFDITGAFTNNYDLLNRIKDASNQTGEMIWELPVDQFRERCRKSDVADYNNSPGRDGHASFGAAIIAEFAEDTPWVHLDIAGTSNKKTPHLLGPAGGTGAMVRTLTKIFE